MLLVNIYIGLMCIFPFSVYCKHVLLQVVLSFTPEFVERSHILFYRHALPPSPPLANSWALLPG